MFTVRKTERPSGSGNQRLVPDNVATAGSVIGLLSLPLGWLTLKSSRVAAGTSLRLWEVEWGLVALFVGLWSACLVLSVIAIRRRAVLLGILANIVIVLALVSASIEASRLLAAESLTARVAPGAGFWLTLFAAYVLVFAARQKASPVWKHLISWTGLATFFGLLFLGWFDSISVMQEYLGQEERFAQELIKHVYLFAGSVAIGTLMGIPLGVWAARSRSAEKPIFFIANITQTIPSLALFGLLIAPLSALSFAPLSALSFAFPTLRELGIRGVGAAPAMIALIIYTLLPVIQNTYVSLRNLDPAVIDAGRGMGMSRMQVFRRIEVPLATPIVLEGVRIASVQSVGLTAVAALIGAGGLGAFVFQGLGQAAPDLIILGAIPIIVLALVVDALMRVVIRISRPRGLAGGGA